MSKRRRAESPPDFDDLFRDDDNLNETACEATTPPPMAAYSERFLDAQKAAVDLVHNFTTKYKACKAAGYGNDEINGIAILLDLERDPAKQYPPALPISLYGRIGVGKSLTISSLLDTADISADSDGIQRGTQLVHEFSAAGPWQVTKYEVNSRYYSLAQISKKVKKLCEDIFAYLECNDSPSIQDDSAHDEKAEKEEAYDEAFDYFQTLLCGTRRVGSESELENSFIKEYHRQKAVSAQSSAQKVSSTQAADKMMDAITELMDGRGLVDGVEKRTANTSEELSAALAAVAATGKAEGPQIWPIISKIEVHYKLPFLNEGIVIADTPGIMDSNKAVVEGTMAYIAQGGTVLIVMPIERCGEDSNLEDILKAMCRLGKQDQIVVVLTKTDVIKKITPETRKNLTPKYAAELREAEKMVEVLKAEENQISSRRDYFEAHPEQLGAALEEFLELGKRQKEMPDLASKADNRVKQVLVENRNFKARASLAGGLKKAMRSVNAPELPVYCVSGSEYKKYLVPEDSKDPPWLTKNGTGIPALQQLLLRLPAAKKLEALQLICAYKLPMHFRNVIATLEKHELKTHSVDIAQLRSRILQGWKTQCKSNVDFLNREMKAAFRDDVKYDFRQLSVNASWGRKVGRLVERWRKHSSATFRAVCKRSGVFKPRNSASLINWTEDFEAILRPKVKPSFDALDYSFRSNRRSIEGAIVKMCQDIPRLLQEKQYRGLPKKDSFFALIGPANDEMLRRSFTLLGNLWKDVQAICVNTVSGDAAITPYFLRAMQESYNSAGATAANVRSEKYAKNTQGGRAHHVRGDIIQEGVLGAAADPGANKAAVSSVTEAICALAEEEFGIKVDRACRNLEAILDEGLGTITTAFDRRWVAQAVPVYKDAKHIKTLLGAAREAVEQLDGPIKGHLDACESYLNPTGQED